ncbi:sensor histidine kinase [Oceaniglobus indicus]|uniref:sensor histidine kinase n=1 Tax=Oceaniglobus indicus TaxID=2047749 RepID=UPI000C19A4D8|nr:sensor histidine kinase [Oceaniglobus indicus]
MPRDAHPNSEPEILEFLALSDDAFCICRMVDDADGSAPDFVITRPNPAFARITGIGDAEGRTALELFSGVDPAFIAKCAEIVQARKPHRFCHFQPAFKRDFDVFVAPLSAPGHFALTFRDISRARRLAARRDNDLKRARAMLVELNHRVMNSLSMISGIVAMEARKRSNPDVTRPLVKVRDRVHALAVLYKTLNSADTVDRVQADTYLGAVLDGLAQSVTDASRVILRPHLDAIPLSTRTAVPLGLIVNELVTNALKYAFTDKAQGRIDVSLTRDGAKLRLQVADDGGGMGHGLILGSGAGSKLTEAFVTQIDGESRLESSSDGTTVTVWFPDYLDGHDPDGGDA